MEHLKKNFGFGFMRLPMKDGEIDLAETSKMVDAWLSPAPAHPPASEGRGKGV